MAHYLIRINRQLVDLSRNALESVRIECAADVTSLAVKATMPIDGPEQIIITGDRLRTLYVHFHGLPVVRRVQVPETVTRIFGICDVAVDFDGFEGVDGLPGAFRSIGELGRLDYDAIRAAQNFRKIN